MNKYIFIISSVFLLTIVWIYFYIENLKLDKMQSDKILQQNILCWEKKAEYIKEEKNNNNVYWKTWFSPVLNTCILEGNFYSLVPIEEWDNYINKFIVDTLKKERIWNIAYFESFWFEWWAYLPEICKIDFNIIENTWDSVHLFLPLVTESTTGQEIFNTEFNYINCLNYLQWNNEKLELKINNLEFKYDYNTFNHIR